MADRAAPAHTEAAPAGGADPEERDLDGGDLERADGLVRRFLDGLVAYEPDEATRIGVPGHDHDLPDLSVATVDAWVRDLSSLRDEVTAQRAAIGDDRRGDGREAAGDLDLLADDLDTRLFWLDTRPRLTFDPLAALDVASGSIHELLRRTDLPDHERRLRVESAAARARRLPRLLEQAGQLLQRAPAPHLDVALQRLPGVVALVGEQLPALAETLGADVTAARDAGEVATEGLEAYGALLSELAGDPPADWRLGPKQHATMLRSTLGTAMEVDEIERRASRWIEVVHAEMAELSGRMWAATYPGELAPSDAEGRIRRVLAAVADDAVPRDRFVALGRAAVDEARAFALASQLTDVPPARLLTVTEVPPYLQGVATAFISEPPPLDSAAGCTYYLSPVPDHWDDDRAESYLREYNPALLRGMAVHEGYPGHFVQLAHAGEHPRLARRLLFSSAFAEGWAVYIERQAVALDFGDDRYRLTQRKMELRIAANALLDVGLHAGEMSDVEATALMVDRSFQEPAAAEGKLVRAKVTSGQLCAYFVGGAEVGYLRRDVERAAGDGFRIGDFHQRLLSHGTPTVAIARAALADPTAEVRRPFA